jgi:hypothetical protein
MRSPINDIMCIRFVMKRPVGYPAATMGRKSIDRAYKGCREQKTGQRFQNPDMPGDMKPLMVDIHESRSLFIFVFGICRIGCLFHRCGEIRSHVVV